LSPYSRTNDIQYYQNGYFLPACRNHTPCPRQGSSVEKAAEGVHAGWLLYIEGCDIFWLDCFDDD